MPKAEEALRKLSEIDQDAAYRAVGACIRQTYEETLRQGGLPWHPNVESIISRLGAGEGLKEQDSVDLRLAESLSPGEYTGRMQELCAAAYHLYAALRCLLDGQLPPGSCFDASAINEIAQANAICLHDADYRQLSYADIYAGQEQCLRLITSFFPDPSVLDESRLRNSPLTD